MTRVWRARFFGPAMGVVVGACLAVSLAMAQRGGQTGGIGGGGGGTGNPGKGTSTPNPSPTPSPTTTQTPTTQTPPPTQSPRPIWVSGRVMMYDGGAPPESVTIERLCSSNSVRAEGYTDSKGQFSFNLGQNNGVFADASTEVFPGFGRGGSSSSNTGGAGGESSSMNPDSLNSDCELRARLPGYRSDTVSLVGRRMLDSPDIGVIFLYPIAGIQGLTASATSGQAPKDARKAFERGLNAVKKSKPDQAELEFRKAVQVYPRYAEAWYELGKGLERREHYPEAREAYASALAADSKYVFPYQQLYQMALREQNWTDLVDKTDRLVHLNPYEFPAAYYFNALAHLQLKEYDAAEKSAQQAVEADRKLTNPKTHYLLGAILIQRQKWTEAALSFRAYLKAAPNATDKAQVEKTLVQLDQQISRVQQASQNSLTQQ